MQIENRKSKYTYFGIFPQNNVAKDNRNGKNISRSYKINQSNAQNYYLFDIQIWVHYHKDKIILYVKSPYRMPL